MADAKRHCPECGLDYLPKGKGHACPHCLLRLAMTGAETPECIVEPPFPAGMKSRFFGDYEILEEIARGGMGVVYRARQLSLNREVALKMIQAGHLLSTEARLRFRMEIEAVAQLNHPNIVSLYESDEHEGVHYFTMRLVEGGNLSDHLERHRSIRDNVTLLVKVARTVHYAHQRGILHRDLKPSNILVDARGEPHVADFGLAKSLDQETGFTYSSSILGSPNYMAPEQATSHTGPVSTAADVYGLGAVLYQILTGQPPFQGRTALETIRQVVDTPPASPRRLNPAVDVDLATIGLKCLEKKPTDRYESAEALARDLENWLEGRPIQARPVGALGLLWRWSKRHPAVTALSCALAVALAGMLIGGPIAMMRIREAQRAAVSHLRDSILDQVRLLPLLRDGAVRTESLRLLRQVADLGDVSEVRARARDDLMAAVAFTDLEFSPQATVPTSDAELSLVDPAFERVAYVADRTNLVLRRLADRHEVRHRGEGLSTITRVETFSPDGRFLAVRHVDGLSFWDTAGGDLHPCLVTNGAQRSYAFAAAGAEVVLEAGGYNLEVIELPSCRVLRHIRGEPGLPEEKPTGWSVLALAPDGLSLAAARPAASLFEMMDYPSGRRRWAVRLDAAVTTVVWQPLYRRLMVATADGLARFMKWDTGEVQGRLRLTGPVRSLAIDPSNTLLASAGEDRVIRLWNLVAYRQMLSRPGDARQLRFDAEGSRLGGVHRGEAAGWLELSRSTEYRETVVGGTSVAVERCEFSPDGRLVVGGMNGKVDLRRVIDGRPVTNLRIGLPIFAWDPLGNALVTADPDGVKYRPFGEEADGRIAIGPTRRVLEETGWRGLAFSGDGRRCFAANLASNAVFMFDAGVTQCLASFGPQDQVSLLASDRSGRRLATGSLTQREARVWDTATGDILRTMPLGRQSRLDLSSDGRWLLVHGDVFALMDVATGRPASPLPFPKPAPLTGSACFSPDGRVLAVVVSQSDVQLFDLRRWQLLGCLRAPREASLASLAFSRDSACLAAGTTQGRLRIWNLDQIRWRLVELKLDWEDPPFPSSRPQIAIPPPLEVIELGRP